MSLKKVSKLIEKINILHDNLLSPDEAISTIEKDLLLNYIRQLYEEVLVFQTSDERTKTKDSAHHVIDLPAPAAETPAVSSPVVQKATTNIVPASESIVQTEKLLEVDRKSSSLPTESLSNANEPIKEGPEETEDNSFNFSNELLSLFEVKEAKELSEKLSSLPISNLTTAMGINDKFLAVNELFGGNNTAFNECVNMINNMKSYDEAKSFLLRKVAAKYNWGDKEKHSKVESFVSLVKRRFK